MPGSIIGVNRAREHYKGKRYRENSIRGLARVHYRGKCLQNIHSVHSRRLQDRIHSSLSLPLSLSLKYNLFHPNTTCFSQIQLLSSKYNFYPPNTSPSSKYKFSEYISSSSQPFQLQTKYILLKRACGTWVHI